MKEIADIIRTAFTDRIKNRFPGTYLVTWLVWNFGPVIRVLFGSGEFEQRLDSFSLRWWDFAIPVVLAFVYLGASPWLSHAVDLVQSAGINTRKKRKRDLQRDDLKAEIELERLRSELEYDRLKTAATRNLREEVQNRIDEHLKTIDVPELVSSLTRSAIGGGERNTWLEIIEGLRQVGLTTDKDQVRSELDRLIHEAQMAVAGEDLTDKMWTQFKIEYDRIRKMIDAGIFQTDENEAAYIVDLLGNLQIVFRSAVNI